MCAKVLVVEDEADLNQLLTYNLEKAGFDVASVMDGEDAVIAVEDEAPDLVLLDWMLPNVSGLEICRQLRARKATARLPIIMLTARGEEEDRVRGLEHGADDYVAKPFSVGEVMARVKALLRRANPAVAANTITHGATHRNSERLWHTRYRIGGVDLEPGCGTGRDL